MSAIMPLNEDQKMSELLVKRLRHSAVIVCLLVIVASAVVVIRALTGEPIFGESLIPGAPMSPVCAGLFAILNLSQLIWIYRVDQGKKNHCWLGFFGSWFVLFSGAGLLHRQIAFGETSNANTLFELAPWLFRFHSPYPEILVGLVILSLSQLITHQRHINMALAHIGSLLVLLFSVWTLNVSLLDMPWTFLPRIPHSVTHGVSATSLFFLALSALAILFAQPKRSFMSLIISPTSGGIMARKLLSTFIIIPTAIGVIAYLFWQLHWFDSSVVGAASALIVIISLIFVTWFTARKMERVDNERARIEQELFRSNQLLDLILNNLPVGVWFTDVNKSLLKANPAARSIWGDFSLENASLIGRSRAWDMESGKEVPGRAPALGVGQKILQVEPPHGVPRVILSSAVPIHGESEEFSGTLMVDLDITDSFRLERQNKLLAKAGLDLMQPSDLNSLLERAAKVAVPDLADICLLGFRSLDGSIKWSASEPVAENITEKLCSTFRKVLEDGITRRTSIDGSRALIVPLLTPRGVNGAMIFLLSPSGRNLNMDLQQTAEEVGRLAGLALENAVIHLNLEASILAREEVCAVVSHDLRNPLGAISGAADLLSEHLHEHLNIDPQATELLRLMKNASQHMLILVGDLLEVAKLEKGTLTINCRPVNVAQLIGEIVEVFSPQMQLRNIKLSTCIATDLPEIYCDSDRAFQVLSNLLGNSLKFTQPGGAINIHAELDGVDWIRLSVIDSGVGISPEILPHIFDRYWQPRVAAKHGAGLGLYIARSIVESHRGKIWAESSQGHGAKISFTLPTVLNRSAMGEVNANQLGDTNSLRRAH